MVASRQVVESLPRKPPVLVPAPTSSRRAARDDEAFLPAVGTNLRRLRTRRGLSLERLARQSGVSRAMLSQVELDTAPRPSTCCGRSRALSGLRSLRWFSLTPEAGPLLLRESAAKRLTSRDGTFISRALFPFDKPRRVEFYELRLKPHTLEEAEPHPPGTAENIVVNSGAVTIMVELQRMNSAREMRCFSSPMWRTPITTAATAMS